MQWDQRFLSTSRGQVLLALRRCPQAVEELARAVQLSRNAIRSHLSILERDGLVQRAGNQPGAGKPRSLYELTSAAEQLFSQAYAPVLRHLLNVLQKQLPAGELDELLNEVGQRMAQDQGVAEADVMVRVERAMAMLDQLGGLAIADLLEQMLGAPVRERCDRSQPPRCCF